MVARLAGRPFLGPRCEITAPGQTWRADHVPSTGRGDRNQQRSGGRMAGRHDIGSKAAVVMNRSGGMADPKLHSSLIFGLDSWRTPFFRVRHGVNRARVAPRDDCDESGRTIASPVCAVISGWNRSALVSVDCVLRAGTASIMHANSIDTADRPRIIPMPFNPHVSRINGATTDSTLVRYNISNVRSRNISECINIIFRAMTRGLAVNLKSVSHDESHRRRCSVPVPSRRDCPERDSDVRLGRGV